MSLVLQVHCPNVSGCCVSVLLRHHFSVFHPALASQFTFLTRWVVSPCGDLIEEPDCLLLQDYFDAVLRLSFSQLTDSVPPSGNLVTH